MDDRCACNAGCDRFLLRSRDLRGSTIAHVWPVRSIPSRSDTITSEGAFFYRRRLYYRFSLNITRTRRRRCQRVVVMIATRQTWCTRQYCCILLFVETVECDDHHWHSIVLDDRRWNLAMPAASESVSDEATTSLVVFALRASSPPRTPCDHSVTLGDLSSKCWVNFRSRSCGEKPAEVPFFFTRNRYTITGFRHESTTAMRDLGTGSIASTHEAETSRAARSPPDDRNYPSALDLRLRARRSLLESRPRQFLSLTLR